jgi:cell division protease FtsH
MIMPSDVSGKDYSEHTAEIVDEEIRRLIDGAYAETKTIIEEHRDAMERLASALIKYETLDAVDVMQIIEGKTLDKPTVGDLLDAEQNKDKDRSSSVGATHSPPVPRPEGPLPEPS